MKYSHASWFFPIALAHWYQWFLRCCGKWSLRARLLNYKECNEKGNAIKKQSNGIGSKIIDFLSSVYLLIGWCEGKQFHSLFSVY